MQDGAGRAKLVHAGFGATTIQRFESGKPSNPSTLALLRIAFESHGILFIGADEMAGDGVRLKEPECVEIMQYR